MVRIDEDEWHLTPAVTSVPAGKVTFVVVNRGKLDHEVVLLKTDKAPGALAIPPGTSKIDEAAAGENVGEVEVEAGTTGSGTFELAPGKYVLVCNVAAHYQQGMYALIEVKAAVAGRPNAPAAVQPQAPAQLPAAVAVPGGSKEVAGVSAVRANLVNVIDALQKGDTAGARKAIKAYNTAWNGVEVYVSFRSSAMYSDIETVWEAKVTSMLDAAQPAAEILPVAQTLLDKYDGAIKLVQAGPAISPLFDDVAALRILRTNTIRDAVPALKAGDVATAKPLLTTFITKWADVEDLVHARSADAYADIEAAMAKVNTAVQKPNPTAAEVAPLVDTLSARFNFAVSLATAAARGADPTKTTFSKDDVQVAADLATITNELKASLATWQGGKFQESGDHARIANGKLFASVSAALKAKNGADAPLQKALDAYTALADKSGNASAVGAAQQAAVDAVAIAQQAMVGQFWGDSKLKDAISSALSGR